MQGSYLLTFSVKAKVYSAKFQQAIAKIRSLNFTYFLHEITFPSSILEGPAMKVGHFLIKKGLHFDYWQSRLM